jgi:hypothetical protein
MPPSDEEFGGRLTSMYAELRLPQYGAFAGFLNSSIFMLLPPRMKDSKL